MSLLSLLSGPPFTLNTAKIQVLHSHSLLSNYQSLCTEHALRKVHSQSHFFPIFSGFTKFFPVALACLTLVPCLAAVHWSYSVNPIYAKTRKSVEKPPKDRNTRWVTVWSIFSAFTRIATLALLIFIYYEHWKDVQVSFSSLKFDIA